MATNVAQVDNFEADYFIDTFVASNAPVADAVVNQSFIFAGLPSNVQAIVEEEYDTYAAANNTLCVRGANAVTGIEQQRNAALRIDLPDDEAGALVELELEGVTAGSGATGRIGRVGSGQA